VKSPLTLPQNSSSVVIFNVDILKQLNSVSFGSTNHSSLNTESLMLPSNHGTLMFKKLFSVLLVSNSILIGLISTKDQVVLFLNSTPQLLNKESPLQLLQFYKLLKISLLKPSQLLNLDLIIKKKNLLCN